MEKPNCPMFSSGPCAKYPGWRPPSGKWAGRSHRSEDGLRLIRDVADLQKKVLKIPSHYRLATVDASACGAMEMLLWSLLGARGIDVMACCVFSNHWANDIVRELKISDVRLIRADFPEIPDISLADFDRDMVFCMSSTTSGAVFRQTHMIPDDRKGLVICDAASAVFTTDIEWTKLDAVAFSWQKGLGGEAGFGTVVLSPRALERLESYRPDRPIPRIFRMTENNRVNTSLFEGYTINTPSMICLEDFRNGLIWADNYGGAEALIRKTEQNYETIRRLISEQDFFRFLVEEKYRAHHAVCLDVVSEEYQSKSDEDKWIFLKKVVKFCEREEVGFDFLGHIRTKPHLRIWTGPTVDSEDLEKFFPWLRLACDKTAAECS